MPVDELTALGQKMRQARKNAGLTQQELSDQSHVSVKQIANIEKGKMNPSYLILRALARVWIRLKMLSPWMERLILLLHGMGRCIEIDNFQFVAQ